MLEYSKLILKKVSFDSGLFEKELKKSISYLQQEEVMELLKWAKTHYSEYSDILSGVQQWFFR